METRTVLGRSGIKVPQMGVGVMTWGQPKGLARLHPAKTSYGGGPESREEEQITFETSLQAGVNFFDTAAMYAGGASERRLGELAQDKDVLIASKFPGSFFFRVDDFPKEVDSSLARLGRNSIDLYQHHFPNRSLSIPELMNRMADAVDAGKVKAVGVSNYSAEQMRSAHEALAKRGMPLASNQVEYSLLHRQPETNGMLVACRELGVTLIAYQPLASGALTGKYLSGPRPTGLRRFMPYFRASQQEAVTSVVQLLREIGERYGKGPAQVALRWLIQQDNVIPIPGAKNARQMASNAEALTFNLTSEEVDQIAQATTAWRS
jgi:aryl-alcohol dehydrogenase-like predicted oxidoreductase